MLCVDDDEIVLDVVQTILQTHGYSVLTATSGCQAVEVFRENWIDLVLVDYEMPGMKGHEVAKEVRLLNPQVTIALHSGVTRVS